MNLYSRVVNKTNIAFSNDELSLLNEGLKYNLRHKHKYWINNLAFAAEIAITSLPTNEQVCHSNHNKLVVFEGNFLILLVTTPPHI